MVAANLPCGLSSSALSYLIFAALLYIMLSHFVDMSPVVEYSVWSAVACLLG